MRHLNTPTPRTVPLMTQPSASLAYNRVKKLLTLRPAGRAPQPPQRRGGLCACAMLGGGSGPGPAAIPGPGPPAPGSPAGGRREAAAGGRAAGGSPSAPHAPPAAPPWRWWCWWRPGEAGGAAGPPPGRGERVRRGHAARWLLRGAGRLLASGLRVLTSRYVLRLKASPQVSSHKHRAAEGPLGVAVHRHPPALPHRRAPVPCGESQNP